MSAYPFVIVGAGLAGAKAAETLRQEGFSGPVVLLGAEPERPYERPPLSKGVLTGSAERDTMYVHEAGWYEQNEVELRLSTRSTHLDVMAHEITLENGERLTYSKALIVTGASPRRLHLPGADLAGVHYLRSAADSDQLKAALAGGGRRVVVIGAGWIGLETAAAARGYGNDVTVIEPASTPLHAVLGAELGEVFAGLHRERGVDLRTQTGVGELRGAGGQVTSVVTVAGDEILADVVIIGVGVQPNVELIEGAGLTVDNGALVDKSFQTTDPDVYAAGDIANAYNTLLGRHLRVEHWSNALTSGPLAARSMLGQSVAYDSVPYFFTDQYDLGMEYAGHAMPGDFDRIVHRGELASREFVAFWMSEDRIVAGMNVNVWDVNEPIQELIRKRTRVDEAKLLDPDVPLTEVGAPDGSA